MRVLSLYWNNGGTGVKVLTRVTSERVIDSVDGQTVTANEHESRMLVLVVIPHDLELCFDIHIA